MEPSLSTVPVTHWPSSTSTLLASTELTMSTSQWSATLSSRPQVRLFHHCFLLSYATARSVSNISPGGSIAVVAFLLQLSPFGYTIPLFDSVFAHLDAITQPGTFTQTGPLDFSGIISHLNSHGIYEYSGSLTTPPCSESVPWLISTEPLPVNVQTYNAVKSILKFNARYTQNNLGQPNLLENAADELKSN